MEFIRESWNRRSTAEEFLDGVKSQFIAPNIMDVVSGLVNLCGSDTEPNPLFLKYLEVLCVKISDPCMNCFAEYERYNQHGLVRLLDHCGDRLFERLEIGNEKSALWALNALKLCLESDFDTSKAIARVSDSGHFAVLIASSKLWFNDQIVALRRLFEEKVPQSDYPPSIPFPQTLLRRAMLVDDLTEHLLFGRNEIITAVVSNMKMWAFTPKAFSFVHKSTFYHMYIHVLSDFLENPTMMKAYMVTNLLVRVVNHIGDREMPKMDDGSTHFDREAVMELFRSLKDHQNDGDEVSIILRRKERQQCDYNCELNLDEVEELLTRVPTSIDNDRIVETVYEYPSFSSRVVPHVLSQMDINDLDKTSNLLKQLMDVMVDTKFLIMKQGIFFNTLSETLEFASSVTDPSKFFMIWMFPITLLRMSWGTGSEELRERIMTYVASYEPIHTRVFLQHLLQIPSDEDYNTSLRANTPMMECISLLHRLMLDRRMLDSCIPYLSAKPYLWPSVLIWGFARPGPDLKKLLQLEIPDTPLVNFLFFFMMLKVTKPSKDWLCAAEKPDVRMMQLLPPSKISDINCLINNHLNILSQAVTLRSESLWDIVSSWKAWSSIFGFEEFLRNLILQIIWKTSHVLVPEDAHKLFKSVAYLMPVMGFLREGGHVEIILKIIVELIDQDIDAMPTLIGLADFVLIVICTCPENWEATFGWLLSRCVDMLKEDREVRGSRAIFALRVVKKALYARLLRKMVVTNVSPILSVTNDFQAMIDFFIVKHYCQLHPM